MKKESEKTILLMLWYDAKRGFKREKGYFIRDPHEQKHYDQLLLTSRVSARGRGGRRQVDYSLSKAYCSFEAVTAEDAMEQFRPSLKICFGKTYLHRGLNVLEE